MLNVPDPDLTIGLEISAELMGSPYPWASLGVAIAAAVVTGIIFAPLDLIRTKYVSPYSPPTLFCRLLLTAILQTYPHPYITSEAISYLTTPSASFLPLPSTPDSPNDPPFPHHTRSLTLDPFTPSLASSD